jgi:uncharacterized protein YndB with AHSA1/START domain
MTSKNRITIQAIIKVPRDKVWNYYTEPEHIVNWNQASEDWHTTRAENDLRVGGKFVSRMEAKNKSAGFDFEGIYDVVKPNEYIEYTMPDGRKVEVEFSVKSDNTLVKIIFDPENSNSLERQKQGWQAILNNFKKYVEGIE